MIKLVALDTDGTLLNSKGKILASSKDVIKKALNKGIKIVLCSGRPAAGLRPWLKELGITGSDQYMITLNGAITRNATGKVMTENLVNNHLYRELTKFGKEHRVPFNIVDPDSKIMTADHYVDFVELVQAWENKAGMFIRQPDEMPANFAISKGCFVGDPKKLDKIEPVLRKTFGKELYIVRANRVFLECMNPKVNKGNGLLELGKKIGIKPEEMMAMGDEGNDIAMFKVVGTAVAMGNGSREAKENANYVTASNDEDGIAKSFEKFVLNN